MVWWLWLGDFNHGVIMVGKSEKQGEEVSTFSLLRLTGEQREYFVVQIFPILDTFYFKIFFFLISTLVVFITAISAAFIVIKCFEYITKCAKVTFSYSREVFILIITCSGLHQVPDLLQEEHAAPLLLNRGQGGRRGAAFLLTSMQGVRNYLSSIVFLRISLSSFIYNLFVNYCVLHFLG